MKEIRLVNKPLLAEFRKLPCVACRKRQNGVVAHHIKSRGAGGDDIYVNLMPLCPKHHAEIHTIGLTMFVSKYQLKEFMYERGWRFEGPTHFSSDKRWRNSEKKDYNKVVSEMPD